MLHKSNTNADYNKPINTITLQERDVFMNDINNFNNENFQNMPNPQFTEYPGAQSAPPSQKPPKKRKPHTTAKVAAMLAGVIAIGGGAGFGGAYFANRAQMSAVVDTSRPGKTNSGTKDNTSSREGTPTLDELQNDVTVPQHTLTSGVELKTDGSYMYTRDLVNAVRDSVVYIETYIEYRGQKTQYAAASGIIISKDGYVVTNDHVVANGTSFTVKVNTTDPETGISESKTYDAELCGTDADTDLAVLKIDGVDDLPAAKLGDSDKLRLGDDVIAIGNPLGYETSVSKGIISGLNRRVDTDRRSLTAIQTDAPINSGNSGGALFNTYGEVVGVVNEKRVDSYAENVGFAITINEAKDVIEDLIDQGYISGRTMMGISTRTISETMATYLGETAGWLVAEIKPGFPVEHSGLLVGDTIIKIDGISVFNSDVMDVFYEKKAGDTVTVTVVRTNSLGREKNVDIEIELVDYDGS